MKGDFEVMPVGTAERLEALEAYAREASEALARMAADGRFELLRVPVAGERLANVTFCEARVDTRIRNARRRYSLAGGGR